MLPSKVEEPCFCSLYIERNLLFSTDIVSGSLYKTITPWKLKSSVLLNLTLLLLPTYFLKSPAQVLLLFMLSSIFLVLIIFETLLHGSCIILFSHSRFMQLWSVKKLQSRVPKITATMFVTALHLLNSYVDVVKIFLLHIMIGCRNWISFFFLW